MRFTTNLREMGTYVDHRLLDEWMTIVYAEYDALKAASSANHSSSYTKPSMPLPKLSHFIRERMAELYFTHLLHNSPQESDTSNSGLAKAVA